jgi:hypothetical protein
LFGFFGRRHAFGPNVQDASVFVQPAQLTDFPHAPNALTLIDTGVSNLMLADTGWPAIVLAWGEVSLLHPGAMRLAMPPK